MPIRSFYNSQRLLLAARSTRGTPFILPHQLCDHIIRMSYSFVFVWIRRRINDYPGEVFARQLDLHKPRVKDFEWLRRRGCTSPLNFEAQILIPKFIVNMRSTTRALRQAEIVRHHLLLHHLGLCLVLTSVEMLNSEDQDYSALFARPPS